MTRGPHPCAMFVVDKATGLVAAGAHPTLSDAVDDVMAILSSLDDFFFDDGDEPEQCDDPACPHCRKPEGSA